MRTKILVIAILLAGALFFFDFSCGPAVTRQASDPLDPKTNRMVASLDDPVPTDGNVMWCSAFLVAAAELRDVSGEDCPATIRELLAQSGDGRATLRDEDYFAFGADVSNRADLPRILEEAESRLQDKFPDEEIPRDWDLNAVSIAYAVLRLLLTFDPPYLEVDPVRFPTGDGSRLRARSFGFTAKPADDAPREHANVLYRGDGTTRDRADRAVVDLNAEGEIEIILADQPEGRSLREAWSAVVDRIALEEMDRPSGKLSVPELVFNLRHRFEELEGNPSTTQREPAVIRAEQEVDFRLDRFGLEVRASARVSRDASKGSRDPRNYIFDGPFLLSLRVRGRTDPFFLLWVRNADLCLEP